MESTKIVEAMKYLYIDKKNSLNIEDLYSRIEQEEYDGDNSFKVYLQHYLINVTKSNKLFYNIQIYDENKTFINKLDILIKPFDVSFLEKYFKIPNLKKFI